MGIDALADILLEDSFVLAWHQGAGSLTFYVLASLLKSHPEASSPAIGDWSSYRPAIIQFTGVTSIQGLLKQDSVPRTKDANGDIDYGCIDSLSLLQPGRYSIVGEFGNVSVTADTVSVYLAAST